MMPDIEAIWREGWKAGYQAGRVDGQYDGTYWCDETADWEKSDTFAALKAREQSK